MYSLLVQCNDTRGNSLWGTICLNSIYYIQMPIVEWFPLSFSYVEACVAMLHFLNCPGLFPDLCHCQSVARALYFYHLASLHDMLVITPLCSGKLTSILICWRKLGITWVLRGTQIYFFLTNWHGPDPCSPREHHMSSADREGPPFAGTWSLEIFVINISSFQVTNSTIPSPY